MMTTVRTCFLVLFTLILSISAAPAFAQGDTLSGNVRALNKQEILALISNKTIGYHITVGGNVGGSIGPAQMMKITFTKTEESGGNLTAFSTRSSSQGKWHVNDGSKLVRQYDVAAWGNKPFSVGVFEKNGKYFWKLGEEFQELLSIE